MITRSLMAAIPALLTVAIALAVLGRDARIRAEMRRGWGWARQHPIQAALLAVLASVLIARGGAKPPIKPPDPIPPITLRLYTDDFLELRPLGWEILPGDGAEVDP